MRYWKVVLELACFYKISTQLYLQPSSVESVCDGMPGGGHFDDCAEFSGEEGRSAPSALRPSGRSHAGARSYLPLRVNGFTYPRLPFFTSLVTLALTPSVWGAGTADLDGTHMFLHRTRTLRSSFQHTHRFSCPWSPRLPVAVKALKRSVNLGGSAAPLTRPSASPLIWLVCVRQLGGSAGASRVASIQVRPPNTYSAHHLIKSLSDPMCTLA